MKYRILCVIVCLIIILSTLTGCQLAKTVTYVENTDKLVGVFVTFGEAYNEIINKKLNEKPNQQLNGTNDKDFFDSLTDIKIEGVGSNNSYIFEGVEGYTLFYSAEEAINGKASSSSSYCDGIFYDNKLAVNISDNGESVEMKATAGVSKEYDGIVTLHCIYKRPDESVYLKLGGTRMHVTGENGGSSSLEISNSEETKSNDKSIKNELTFKVTIESKDQFVDLVVLEMDKNNNLIKSNALDESFFNNYSNIFTLQASTEYIILEEHVKDFSGKEIVKRSVYSCTDDSSTPIGHVIYTAMDNKVLYPRSIKFEK